jgi:tRNA threonylcarbamoyladenosine biosynthesis protein TsaE
MMDSLTRVVADEQETRQLAERLATFLLPGDTLCLKGDLGAGKTTFTRYLTAALGATSPVSSPTFTLIHEYQGGRLPIYHVDAYRLRGADDAVGTGIEDYFFRNDGVVMLEWSERIVEILPLNRLELALEEINPPGESRRITITARGSRWLALVKQWLEHPDSC